MRLLAAASALAIALAAASGAGAQSSRVEAIETGELNQLDAWTVGAIARAQGALPPTLWRASDASALSTLFDQLPASFDSPAALQLARRALASAGEAPAGDAAPEAARKRFSALGRIGLADDISVMAAGSGPALEDPLIAQFAAQAELARGRVNDACRRVRNAAGEQPAFLLRLRAYCAAASGEFAAADLALEVARSANAEDAWFRSVINAMAQRPARPPAGRYDTSLNASISIAAQLRPGATPLRNASALALVTVARGGANAPADLRMQAAALAFRRGLIPAAETRAIVLGALAPDAESPPPLAAALRLAERSRGSLETARAIAALLRPNIAYVDFAAAARLFKDDIAALEAAPDAASALAYARAALAAGDVRLATRLLDSAGQAGVSAQALAPLQAAIDVQQRLNARDAALVVQRRIENAATTAAGRRALSRDLTIMAALGLPLSEAAQAHLAANPATGGAAPDAALMAALQRAVDARATGEIALYAALICANGAHTIDGNALAQIIQALRGADLGDAARALAIEGMIGGTPA